MDRLIEGVNDESKTSRGDGGLEPLGLRAIALEYRLDANQRSGSGTAIDHGLGLALRRETAQWGEFYLDAAAQRSDAGVNRATQFESSGARATLYHSNFWITDRLRSDAAVGAVRSSLHPLLGNGQRVVLPQSILQGVASTLTSDGHELRLHAGELGRIDGSGAQSFTRIPGSVAGAGYTRQLDPHWQAGAQVVTVQGATTVPDHSGASAALSYDDVRSSRAKVQWLRDDRARNGTWLDADWLVNGLRHRAGLFRLEHGLLWNEAPIQNDVRGGYWRVEQRGLARTLAGGVELAESNYENAPERTGQSWVLGYGTVTQRIDRTSSVGGTASVRAIAPRGAAVSGSQVGTAGVFSSHRTDLGLSRLDLNWYETRPDLAPQDRGTTLSWSQDWPAGGVVSFATSAAVAVERLNALLHTRYTIGASLRGQLRHNFSTDASLVLTRLYRGAEEETNYNVSLGALWSINRNWSLRSAVSIVNIEPSRPPEGVIATPFVRDRRFFLALRYEDSTGIPYPNAGRGGTGELSGIIYFDENADGTRQPTERPAAGVTVYLDGRIPATTDTQGRFHFSLVPTGTRSIRVTADSLPLPWSTEDNASPSVRVPVRGTGHIEIPLTRLRP